MAIPRANSNVRKSLRIPAIGLVSLIALGSIPFGPQAWADERASPGQPPSTPQGLLFYAPFDDHARGVIMPQRTGVEAECDFVRADGVVGSAAASPARTGIRFPLAPFISNTEGSISVFLKINWDLAETATRRLLDLGQFAELYRWQSQPYLTYALYYHHLDEKHDYGCTYPLSGWGPGQWRHVAITWSWSARKRALYIDGSKVREAAIQRIPNKVSEFRIGPDVDAADELCVFSRALDEEEIQRLFQAGHAGKAAFEAGSIPPALLAAAALPPASPPAPPPFVNWSFDGADRRDNGLRGRITLHGWWRWQRGTSPFEPPDARQWLYRKAPAHSHFVEAFPVRGANFEAIRAADPRVGQPILNGLAQWCQREFSPPADWKGRRVLIEADSVIHEGAIYLNGQLVRTLPRLNLGGRFDVTDTLRWDGPNRLTIFSSGLDGSIALAGEPAGEAIEDAWLETSWRKKSVTAHLRIRAAAAGLGEITVDIFPLRGQEAVRSFSARRQINAGENAFELAADWPDAIGWSLRRPHLYEYRVRLADAAGQPVDETFRARFGFREIWIDGGDFYLNGKPIHFFGHSNSHLTSAAEMGDDAYIRYSLTQWQKAGLNCITPWQGPERNPTLHPLLDIADELGVAVLPYANLPTGEDGPPSGKTRAEWDGLYRAFIERYRQHPSVLSWMIGSGAHNFDFCPAVLDGRFTPDIPRIAPLKESWQRTAQIDPTRPVFGLSNGNAGSVWTSMAYLGLDVDLQARENWPLRWSGKRLKPLMPCEFSLPCHPDWCARTRERSARAQYYPASTQSLATEYGAMLLGPKVYLEETGEYLRSQGESPGRPSLARAFWGIKDLFAETLRPWRAYGMSFIYHAEVPFFYAGKRPDFPATPGPDPRRWSPTPEHLDGSLQAADDLSPYGLRIRDATAPLMGFIGGPDGQFTLKDHGYWSAQPIRKCLVAVNDTDDPARLTADWTLRDAQDQVAAKGRIAFDVSAGRQETTKGAIEFAAPEVKRRTDYVLSVAATADKGQVLQVPAFRLTVFPPDDSARNPAPKSREDGPKTELILFDPVGRTGKALAKARIATAPMPDRLTGRHRLIVGSRALENAAARQTLSRAGFDQAVVEGMRVLVFEQSAPQWDGPMMGLRLKQLATRRTFVRAPGHPALAGLEETDFQFLRGDSDLIEAYPDPGPMPAEYPVHFWHWGNDNMVATFAVEKPQVGAARTILDCGFDLNEAALLEVSRGEGLMLFCQVDVSNRVGHDPVSTRLVRNLADYLADAAARPAPAAELSELIGRHPPREWVEAYVSPTPAVAGIHPGDTFWREKLRLPAFEANSAAPLFTQVEQDGRSCWLTSLSVGQMKTDWQRAKVARIESALRFANGQRSLDGPALESFEDSGKLYPHRWNRLPGLGDIDPYVYWRW